MKVQAKAGVSWLAYEDSDAGEGLAIFLSQASTDLVRWRIEVSAKLDTGANSLVGIIYTSPPRATSPEPGPLSRLVGIAVCPGAVSWSVSVTPAISSLYSENESADFTLTSSKCCTAPSGLVRVSERYGYIASAVSPSNWFPQPGQTITKISARGTGAGTVQIGAGNPNIVVANGLEVILEPKAPIQAGTVITFTNCSWFIEYLESA